MYRPIHIFFNRHGASNYLDDPDGQSLLDLEKRIIPCTSWDDISTSLKSNPTEIPTTICFFVGELEHSTAFEIVNMIHTLSKLIGLEKVSVTAGIAKTTSFRTIKELQKSNVHGIIPTYKDWGVEETIKGLRAQWANVPYWPKHIIEQLPGYKSKPSDSKSFEIKLTVRQQQILDLINTRGASNKIIARMLNISESTVKLHVSAIFRKYNVRNRTQLALFSKKSN